MGVDLKRVGGAVALLCLLLNVAAVDPPFPHISDLEVEFYETEVQITDLTQQIFGIAKEYYNNILELGKVELRAAGNTQSVIYNRDINEILEVNETSCVKWEMDESLYYYEAMFYGWRNTDPLIIGPSAALWIANNKRKDIVYAGKKQVRNVQCDSYTLQIKGPKENVVLTYYFADNSWETPYQFNQLRVPIRIEAKGTSSLTTKGQEVAVPINLSTDFLYFKPYITDDLVFQPPLGIGCPLKTNTMTMPKMPNIFKFTAEVFDVYDTEPDTLKEKNRIVYQKIWYDSLRRMARLDKHTASTFFSALYDFDTGVTYSTENASTCLIKPLRNSYFEAYDNEMIGRIKDPEEVLNLDGDFYYMGKRLFRGMWCDSFESVQMNVEFMNKEVSKLVITVFYSREFYQVEVDGEDEVSVPIYYMATGYRDWKKIINVQYNIFEFDDVIWPPMYLSYRLDRCFPTSTDKTYVVLFMNVEEKLSKKMESEEAMVKFYVRDQITKNAKISEMRIATLTIDYRPDGVAVTVLMVNRPPALKQFFLEFEGQVEVADKNLKVVVSADTEEKCAFECVDNDDFLCLGFYFCNNACFLKSKGIFEKNDDDDKLMDLGESCKTWLRSTRDSTNREPFLEDALKSLEEAVLNQKMKIPLFFKDQTQEIVPISDIIIGDPRTVGPPFPHISDFEVQFYETEVQIADLNKQVFGIAKEYYDNTVPRGKLELQVAGSTQSVYYNNDTDEILEVSVSPKMKKEAGQ